MRFPIKCEAEGFAGAIPKPQRIGAGTCTLENGRNAPNAPLPDSNAAPAASNIYGTIAGSPETSSTNSVEFRNLLG